jgi:hypothetical protein
MREIQLTNGAVTIVDDEDYARLSVYRWRARYHRRRTWYAMRGWSPTISMHRYILDCLPGQEVDHINHDGLDNRRCNLRLCTNSQNQANSQKRAGATSSRFKGVGWHIRERRWMARIRHCGQLCWLGYFDTEEEAARAYNAKAQELFGGFACLNGVEE